jgi:hypothetical protein
MRLAGSTGAVCSLANQASTVRRPVDGTETVPVDSRNALNGSGEGDVYEGARPFKVTSADTRKSLRLRDAVLTTSVRLFPAQCRPDELPGSCLPPLSADGRVPPRTRVHERSLCITLRTSRTGWLSVQCGSKPENQCSLRGHVVRSPSVNYPLAQFVVRHHCATGAGRRDMNSASLQRPYHKVGSALAWLADTAN